jgi:hypothetical protein
MLGKVAGLMLLLAVASCGGGGDSAPEKCEALVARLCQRAIACIPDGTTQAECVASVKTVISCAEADSVSAGYNACMSELQSSPCSVLVTADGELNTPASCEDVILFN